MPIRNFAEVVDLVVTDFGENVPALLLYPQLWWFTVYGWQLSAFGEKNLYTENNEPYIHIEFQGRKP